MAGPVVDCDMAARFRALGFRDDTPVTIQLFDAQRSIGEATFEGLFPGRRSELVTPVDGRIAPGAELIVALPPDYPRDLLAFATAEFYWLDPPPGVPPFHTSSAVEIMPGGRAFRTTAPDQPGLVGRAELVLQLGTNQARRAAPCRGFTDCNATMDGVAGPIEVTIE